MGKRKRNLLKASPGVLDDPEPLPAASPSSDHEEGELSDSEASNKRRAVDASSESVDDILQARYDQATRREQRRLAKKALKRDALLNEPPQIVIQRDKISNGTIKIKVRHWLCVWQC